ncbi:ankyrin repeat-containing domain protein [Xylaria castorea]|nr:ankyrin repeat-containing domain protein [Xylaria castorea]
MTDRTMSSAEVIRADGHARVQIGNSYSTIHNYPDSSRYLADSHLAEMDRAKLRTEFLQRLYTSPYEDRKNRNPKRANGTCEWFTAHPLFQNWQKEISALLWVSADPGCGKSVLAKYLVDDVLPPSTSRITCYFFFKDDFDDQRVLEGALCCILPQLFIQSPVLLSDGVLKDFKEGDKLFASFPKLWNMLIRVTNIHKDSEIICILDALDECVDQTRLPRALTQHYSKGKGTSTLKFLVTSRPYLRIQRDFQDLKESQPTIHLSGESQTEVDKIAHEITISIQQRTEELGKRLRLTEEEKDIVKGELATFRHRTYLWVHLVFAVIEEAIFLSKSDLRTSIRNLPRTVEEAYDNILRKSHDPDKARKILHIIVAVDRPLLLTEMAAVLAFRGESHRCHEDLYRDRLSPDRLYNAMRETCGLFVIVQDSQVYLLHQTAREFLVRLPPNASRYLLLADFKRPVGEGRHRESNDRSDFVFLDYAASNWADHYRQAYNTLGTDLELLAMQLCDTNSPACSYWLEMYGERRTQEPDFLRELPTPLLVASYFGLDNLVNIILQEKKTNLDTTGANNKRTALSLTSEKGYHLIAQSLLDRVPKPIVVLRDRLSLLFPTIVNRTDKLGRSPLWYSAVNGHQIIVQQLLKKGAKVDTKDETGLTPLLCAILHGYSDIVPLLLKKGARHDSKLIEAKGRFGQTALIKAASDGSKGVVKLLLDVGAKVNASDNHGSTALIHASQRGHDATVKLLLDSGARVNALDNYSSTALIYASQRGHDATVKLLLDVGAKVNASDNYGSTALIHASQRGHDATVKLLLDVGARVNVSNNPGSTALIYASQRGHDATVNVLLDFGAEVDDLDNKGSTALIYALQRGHHSIVQVLRDRGADRG